ncbi:MAG: RpiB/LacA/LacB family sugar-phosphate isomerase, partial [Oscillospiraceae bacterium]
MIENKMQIAIGCDHAGVDFKNEIINHLKENGYEVLDCGCYTKDSVDYPDIA